MAADKDEYDSPPVTRADASGAQATADPVRAADPEVAAEASQPRDTRGNRARREAERREAERKAKSAAKLRENLMRRKSQARARRAGAPDETQGLPAAKTDESS